MTALDPADNVVTGALLYTDTLSTNELMALYNCVNAGFDPRSFDFFPRVEGLFTEKSADGIPRLHDVTMEALDRIMADRIRELRG